MMIEIIFYLFLGVVLGILTGLIPGIHPNTVFILVLSLLSFYPFPIQSLLVFTVSLSISNTFADFIPTILFGAPEPDSCLSVLPSHHLLLQGKAYEALFLTVIGGFGSTLLMVVFLPLFLILLPLTYPFIHANLHILLISIVAWMVLMERKRFRAFLVFLLSGLLGLITLNNLGSIYIFPALTGFFGMSTLLISFRTKPKIPEQSFEVSSSGYRKGILTGWLAGVLAGLLPGIGSAQAGILASEVLRSKPKEFIVSLGGINTSNIFFTFFVFYLFHKTRSGAAWFISQVVSSLNQNLLFLLIFSGLTACFLSSFLTLLIGKNIIIKTKHLNYQKTTISVMILLPVLVLLFTGFLGLFIFIISTFTGIFTIISGVKRTNMMGFLLLPTIFYFLGV